MSRHHLAANALRAARCRRPSCGGTYAPAEPEAGRAALVCQRCGRTRAEAERELRRAREGRR